MTVWALFIISIVSGFLAISDCRRNKRPWLLWLTLASWAAFYWFGKEAGW